MRPPSRAPAGLLIAALVLAALPARAASAADSGDDRPNILLIMVDDMGYSDIGCFGSEIRTPNLDSLAESGLRMTSFYSAPACSPARSMLLSGCDNHLAGFGNQKELLAPNQRGLPGYEGYLSDHVVSVAELLRDAGYHTYVAGKWHLGEEPERDASRRGFERSFTLQQGGASHFDDEWMMCANYTPVYRENGERVHVPQGFYSSEFYTDRIIEWTGEQDDERPFFAYLAFTAPHDPLHAPDDWIDRYAGAYDDGYDVLSAARFERLKQLGMLPAEATSFPRLPMLPAWDELPPEQRQTSARAMEIYAAMVSNVDHHVGRLLRHLEEIGERENTLVLFLSDNGANGASMHSYPGTDEAWLDRNSDNRLQNLGRRGSRVAVGAAWAQASMAPFRLFKGFIAEGGIRVPFIASGPGVARRGEHHAAVGHVIDIAATLLDVAGVEHPQTYGGRDVHPIQGRSLRAFLAGEADEVRGPDEPLGWELLSWRALRQGRWKATWITSPFGTSDWQLFDLEADPGETRDLSEAHPDRLLELVRSWERYAEANNVVLPDTPLPLDF